MNLILLGPQGSGKGTQAEIIAKKYGLNYFEAGKILRNTIDPVIQKTINQGNLVPDEYMIELAQEFISSNHTGGLLFDGYPRSVSEYEDLKLLLSKLGQKLDLVLNLEISQEESIKRLLARNRQDDKPESIKRRLDIYHQQTHPVFEQAVKEGIGISIDGMRTVDEIAQEIEEVINEKVIN
jgi:adenylate kinase